MSPLATGSPSPLTSVVTVVSSGASMAEFHVRGDALAHLAGERDLLELARVGAVGGAEDSEELRRRLLVVRLVGVVTAGGERRDEEDGAQCGRRATETSMHGFGFLVESKWPRHASQRP